MIMFDTSNKQVDRQAAGALLRLPFHEDFKVYTAFIQQTLDEYRIRGDNLTGQEREWNQGKCQALDAILNLPTIAKIEARK